MRKLRFASITTISAVFAALGTPHPVAASSLSPITYELVPTTFQNCASCSVTGSITTDGTKGPINASDITAWNLLLTDGSLTQSLVNDPSLQNSFVGSSGTDLSATATQLKYDFSGNGFLQFDNAGFANGTTILLSYLCYASVSGCGVGSQAAQTSAISFEIYTDPFQQETGSVVIAATTPLPAALPLFAAGLGVMGLFGWRRERKNAALAAPT
jgi:hypothetical protein